MPAKKTITIIKRDIHGKETWRYHGRVLRQEPGTIVLEAYFNREDMIFHGMPLYKDDRFIETYYTDRWYNIFEIHAREDDHLRGWYCNITRPAKLEGMTLSYEDLALDLLVFPDGRQIVLDENEFVKLDIPRAQRTQAQSALKQLSADFHRRLGNQKSLA